MKHNWKITLTLIVMFIITQLIGLLVINAYIPNVEPMEINGTIQNVTINPLPYGLGSPEDLDQGTSLISIVIAFAIAILLIFMLSKIRAAILIKLWFFIVIVLVLSVSIFAFEILVPWEIDYKLALIIPLLISVPLAYVKVFKRNLVVHNLTELFIYPGIAAVFVPLLGIWSIIALLILISIYDMWAVWHSGFMQKMAEFQIKELKIFGGFFVPYLNKKQKEKLKALKQKNKFSKAKTKSISMKVNLAILGGGDVVFPIVAAGVALRVWGLIPALSIVVFSSIALFALLKYSKKGKYYPAMPFITAGIFTGMILGYLATLI